MARHFNTSLRENSQKLFNFKSSDSLSTEVGEIISPVVDISNYFLNFIRDGNKTTTGSSQLFVTPADRDFYLVGLTINCMSNAACDNTDIYVGTTIQGQIRNLIYKKKITLTANDFNQSVYFGPKGIKLDRNVSIYYGTNFTVGAASISLCIQGYTTETLTS